MRSPEFFAIIKHVIGPHVKAEHNPNPMENLRDALLRDTLSRALEGEDESLQVVLDNVNTYVEIVHHTEYSPALMQCKPQPTCSCVSTYLYLQSSDYVSRV